MATAAIPSHIHIHIHLDDRGRAWIDDTNTKVIEVVLDKMANDSSPEEVHDQHPHPSMAQVHAALAPNFLGKHRSRPANLGDRGGARRLESMYDRPASATRPRV